MQVSKAEIQDAKDRFSKYKKTQAAANAAQKDLKNLLNEAERLATKRRGPCYDEAMKRVEEAEKWAQGCNLAADEAKKEIMDAIDLLEDQEEKNVIYFKYVQGYSLEQTGLNMNMDPSTIKRRLGKAIIHIIEKRKSQ